MVLSVSVASPAAFGLAAVVADVAAVFVLAAVVADVAAVFGLAAVVADVAAVFGFAVVVPDVAAVFGLAFVVVVVVAAGVVVVGVTWPNSEPVKHKNKNPRICSDYHSGGRAVVN